MIRISVFIILFLLGFQLNCQDSLCNKHSVFKDVDFYTCKSVYKSDSSFVLLYSDSTDVIFGMCMFNKMGRKLSETFHFSNYSSIVSYYELTGSLKTVATKTSLDTIGTTIRYFEGGGILEFYEGTIIRNGRSLGYDITGNLIKDVHYKNDVVFGSGFIKYPNSDVVRYFLDNSGNGDRILINGDGLLTQINEIRNGSLVGKQYYFDELGLTRIENLVKVDKLNLKTETIFQRYK